MPGIGSISYGAGAVAFAALSLLLMTRWRGRLRGGWLLAASIVSVVWCTLLVAYSEAAVTLAGPLFVAEVARDALWLVFLSGLIGGLEGRAPARFRIFVHVLWVSVLVAGAVSGIFSLSGMISGAAHTIFIMGSFLMSLTGLVLVEQIYRNSSQDQRWAIKYLCLGVGGLFAYDLYLYANGTMFRQLDLDLWNARGVVNALVVPLIALAVSRNPQLTSTVFISRQLVFFTSSLLAVGCYLLAMAAGGYYVREFGGNWGAVIQAIFLFAGLVILVIMLFSGQLRASLRVFVAKHFFDYKYDYREEWLRLTRTLSETRATTNLHEQALVALARIVESPGAALWRNREEEGLVPLAGWNMTPPDNAVEPAGSAFLEFIQSREWVVDIAEYARQPSLYGDVRLPQWLGSVRAAWLIVPLMREDRLWGVAVLAKPRATQDLTWEDRDLLKTAGRQVTSYLALDDAAQELTEGRQFQAFNQLTAFIMHDLKNLIAQQSLVVKNAARHKDNPAFIEDAIATVDNSVQRMNRLLEQLQHGDTESHRRRVSLAALASEVVTNCRKRNPAPSLSVAQDADKLVVRVGRERFAMVLGHVVRNAQDAATATGEVALQLRREDNFAVIEVVDNGCGMDEEFVRTRLFRPFDSTKGSKGMGIGAHQTRQFVRSAGGEVQVLSRIGEGTTFRIRLPLAETDGAGSAPPESNGLAAQPPDSSQQGFAQ